MVLLQCLLEGGAGLGALFKHPDVRLPYLSESRRWLQSLMPLHCLLQCGAGLGRVQGPQPRPPHIPESPQKSLGWCCCTVC